MDPDVDEVVKGGVVEGHIISTTVQLVLVEGYQAPVVDQVIHRQPLLEDVPKVLLRVLRPKQGRIDDLKPVTTTLTRRSVSSSCTSLVDGYFSPSENVVRAVFSILVNRGLPT